MNFASSGLLKIYFANHCGKRAGRKAIVSSGYGTKWQSPNWSLCDRIAKLHLGPGDEILAVEAEGLPMRGITIRPGDREVRLPSDYWKHFDKYAKPLPGGAPQLFLYLVPPTHVSPYW